jgi:tetratricopeptide (TPR) repeat protein
MQRILKVLLAVGISLAPVVMQSTNQPVWGQTQEPPSVETLEFIAQALKRALQEEPQQAIETFKQVLAIARKVKDRKWEALALGNIGALYSKIGQPQKALEYYKQALPIERAVGDRAGEAVSLHNIGALYSDIGQPQKALEFYNQALRIKAAVGGGASEAITLKLKGLWRFFN